MQIGTRIITRKLALRATILNGDSALQTIVSGYNVTQVAHEQAQCNAKFLWKRIPPNIISSNPEIAAIWTVGQKLWKKDLAGTYQALAIYNWTEPISNIIRALEERVRERALNLIGRSYSSISHNTMVSMTGLSNEAIAQICKERKWEISEDGTTIKPTPPVQPTPLHTSSEDQLFKLTEFVSFLEN
ncbi:COP9 signalosome complex subunit 8 [Papilio machaon]|uniref:COP9 signalosome complex subunit 8 n=1 Tax=Papilio machaon TaxID=76193 RepID=A0A194QLW4_PAPMA|nr:COP9 signalosome complex subunit 8 [Papilio machaon]